MKTIANTTTVRRPGWALIVLLFGLAVIAASFIEPDRVHKLQDPVFHALDNFGDQVFPLFMLTVGAFMMLSAPFVYFQWPSGWWKEVGEILAGFRSRAYRRKHAAH